MANGSQHKMYDYEVAPPPGIWEKIEAELDESELSHKYPAALYQYEVAAPASAWQKIATSLDESGLVSDYASKLSAIEVAPPADAWNKIKTALDPEPLRRRIPAFIKYAAAAAVIALLVFGGIRLFNNTGGDNVSLADNTNTNPAPEHLSNPDNKTVPAANSEIAVADLNAAIEEARNDAALEASKGTLAKLESGAKRSKVKNAADFFFVADDYNYSSTGQVRGLTFDDIEPPPTPDMTNRYIVFMTPDGNIIRMSKKLGDMVCCVSGEEVDKDCVDQMKKWREKIASPSATHTPGNFLDLLHMINSLQDN